MLFSNMLNQKSVSVSYFFILRFIGDKYMNFHVICQNFLSFLVFKITFSRFQTLEKLLSGSEGFIRSKLN